MTQSTEDHKLAIESGEKYTDELKRQLDKSLEDIKECRWEDAAVKFAAIAESLYKAALALQQMNEESGGWLFSDGKPKAKEEK